MANLYLRNEPDDDGEGVLFCSGQDIDDQSTEQDAVIEMVATNDDGYFEGVHLCPYGYNWNLEEAKAIHEFLGDAIREAEIAKEHE